MTLIFQSRLLPGRYCQGSVALYGLETLGGICLDVIQLVAAQVLAQVLHLMPLQVRPDKLYGAQFGRIAEQAPNQNLPGGRRQTGGYRLATMRGQVIPHHQRPAADDPIQSRQVLENFHGLYGSTNQAPVKPLLTQTYHQRQLLPVKAGIQYRHMADGAQVQTWHGRWLPSKAAACPKGLRNHPCGSVANSLIQVTLHRQLTPRRCATSVRMDL